MTVSQRCNVFFLDEGPRASAMCLSDIHLARMPIQIAQILSTIIWEHRYRNDPIRGERNSASYPHLRWYAKHFPNPNLYLPLRTDRTWVMWAESDRLHALWLFRHLQEMLQEYERRFEDTHTTSRILRSLEEGIFTMPFDRPVGREVPIISQADIFIPREVVDAGTSLYYINSSNWRVVGWGENALNPFADGRRGAHPDGFTDSHLSTRPLNEIRCVQYRAYYSHFKFSICKWTHSETDGTGIVPHWFEDYQIAQGRTFISEPSKRMRGKIETRVVC